nr:unnamed protein product [Digitaria exilis]
MAEKLAPEKRHAFVHNGQTVFEWDQTLEEVNMYIELPKGVPTKLFSCTIQAGHVEVGIRGNPPYLNNPGFDFSQAQFSGTCPDPRSFMGGIRSE